MSQIDSYAINLPSIMLQEIDLNKQFIKELTSNM